MESLANTHELVNVLCSRRCVGSCQSARDKECALPAAPPSSPTFRIRLSTHVNERMCMALPMDLYPPSLSAPRSASEKQNHISHSLERCGPVVEDDPRRSNCQAMSASSIRFSMRYLPVFSGAIAGCRASQAVVVAVGIRFLMFLGLWLGTTLAAWIWNLRLDDVFGRRGTLYVRGNYSPPF